jgi:hypothetical protein
MNKVCSCALAVLVLATNLTACTEDGPTTVDSAEPPSMNITCGNGFIPLWSNGFLGENKPIEAQGTLWSGCGYYVMTGLGGRIKTESNWTTVHLYGRQVFIDGTMGAETVQKFGPESSFDAELTANVPPGYAVVGVGVGEQNDNVSVISLQYRQVSVVNGQLQLVGPTYTTIVGTGNVEISHLLTDDFQVFIGAGFGSSANNVTRMAWWSGALQ